MKKQSYLQKMKNSTDYKIVKEVKGIKSDNPNDNAEVGIFIDTLPNGKKTLRVIGEHIPEDLKNELMKILGHKTKYVKVVAEECQYLDCPTYDK